jgi:hypothetical protein
MTDKVDNTSCARPVDNIADDAAVPKVIGGTAGGGVGPLKSIQLSSIDVPEYYIGSIPADLQSVYKVLGVRYVCVRHADRTYYILEDVLPCVVKNRKLYA